jgi:GDP-4-dehydro-6-deoxy-D-mannose reductase
MAIRSGVKRILVTGVSGFVGKYMVRELASAGHRVWGLSRVQREDAIEGLEQHVIADLLDEDAIRTALSTIKPNIILHLAAQSNPALSWELPLDTFEANVGMTISMLRAARICPEARFYFVSSSDVYGRPEERFLPISEQQALVPDNPYAVSKISAEHCARLYGQRSGLEVGIIRPFSHTGPGQTSSFVVPSFAKQIAEIEFGIREYLNHGDVSTYRDFTDVRDIVRAYRLILEHPRCIPVVNVCSGKTIQIQTILEKLMQQAKVEIRVKVDPNRQRMEKSTPLRGSNELLIRETGWEAEYSMEQTLADVLDEQRRHLAVSQSTKRFEGS